MFRFTITPLGIPALKSGIEIYLDVRPHVESRGRIEAQRFPVQRRWEHLSVIIEICGLPVIGLRR